MNASSHSDFAEDDPTKGRHYFATTHWSIVARAGGQSSEATAALENLCRAYWLPLYAYVRRRGYSLHEAEDLTQAFFALLLERKDIEMADQTKGKFRSFLLGALNHFLASQWHRANCQKRGGGYAFVSVEKMLEQENQNLNETMTPERVYEKRWAETIFQRSLIGLESEFTKLGQGERFHTLKIFLIGASTATVSYEAAATRLNLSESAVKSAIFRMRQRFAELFRAEIANTVEDPNEINTEIRYVLSILTSCV